MTRESRLGDPIGQAAFDAAIARARIMLRPPVVGDSPLPALAAAAFFAICALTFAASAVLAPPNVVTPAARAGVR